MHAFLYICQIVAGILERSESLHRPDVILEGNGTWHTDHAVWDTHARVHGVIMMTRGSVSTKVREYRAFVNFSRY